MRKRKTFDKRLEEGQKLSNATLNTLKTYAKSKTCIYKRINDIITPKPNHFAYFLTYTISDQYINMPPHILVRALKKDLNLHTTQYVANEDYGKTTDRLHYHAITETDTSIVTNYTKGINMMINTTWTYGHVHVQQITVTDKDQFAHKRKLTEYLLKTTNHAIKQTAGSIIYSRRKRK